MQRPMGWLPWLAALCAFASCVESGDAIVASEQGDVYTTPASCGDPGAYTPYGTGTHPVGSLDELPWEGSTTAYPAGVEDFRAYTALATVECGSNKSARSYLDVTAGCLVATAATRGEIVSTAGGAFRALALGYTEDDPEHAIKWTDQSIEYRFFYTATSGAGVNPGFKAFARYRTEDDLYVASWRMDGVVQIQKKECGSYTALKILKTYGPPAPNVWHTIRFDAVGNQLSLYLDGVRVIAITDDTFAWGTVGIRTDAVTGALIDDWRVTAGGDERGAREHAQTAIRQR